MKFDVEAWKYALEYWLPLFGNIPEEIIISSDASHDYEMHRCHVFKLRERCYALVVEEGCSCYDFDDAEISLYDTATRAEKGYEKWRANLREEEKEAFKEKFAKADPVVEPTTSTPSVSMSGATYVVSGDVFKPKEVEVVIQ